MNPDNDTPAKGDILIVDDDLPSLSTLSSMLTTEGYEVRGVPDGPMALTVIENKPPELILLDVKMPGMDGFEVCQQIKADEKSSGIPILFLSALDEVTDKVKGFEAGAVDFITKPFQAEEVLARVDTHLILCRLRRNLELLVEKRTAELTESEERYRLMVSASPVSIMAIRDGCILFSNPAGVRMLGFSDPDEMLGISVIDLVAPESQQLVTEHIQRLENGKDNLLAEINLIRQDGIKVTVESTSVPVPIGGIPTAVIISQDISERKKAEEELRTAFNEIKDLKDRIEQENIYLREEIELEYKHGEIVGKSNAIKHVLRQAEQVAETETSILILGETGTGKELLARAIHRMSSRKNRQMITVNCAALPSTLIESEMFGREKGAFTGALSRQIGRFELADGSTIFLDEIGDLPIELQAKLLRVLHEGEFERLGSTKTLSVDVRVIAATNHDLEQAVREGSFRKDLYYRLNVFPITIPPLRERKDDIPLLVWAFVKEFGKSMGKSIEQIPKKTIDMLQSYSWPGNGRELRNVIERAMILNSGQTFHIDRIRSEDLEAEQPVRLEEVERRHIVDMLERTGWRVSGKKGAAEILGLKPTTLEARMKKLGIERPY